MGLDAPACTADGAGAHGGNGMRYSLRMAAVMLGAAACASSGVRSQAPIARMTRVTAESSYLNATRVRQLPAPQRADWERYLARSADLQRSDRALIAAELR